MELETDIALQPIESVIPYSNNAKEHPAEQVDKIASSIKNYGWDQPIVVDGGNEIIKGHGRLQAAKKLQLGQVPVIKRTDLTEAEAKAARIADNKTAESDWLDDELATELELLDENFDFDLDLTGFEIDEIDDLFDDVNDSENDDKYTDKIESPVYEPTGEEPELLELFDTERYEQLIAQIERSDVSGELEQFLRFAAQRHIVFDYENIAEFYAHQKPELQKLFEALTLVIVDMDQAIEQGYTQFAKDALKGVGDD